MRRVQINSTTTVMYYVLYIQYVIDKCNYAHSVSCMSCFFKNERNNGKSVF